MLLAAVCDRAPLELATMARRPRGNKAHEPPTFSGVVPVSAIEPPVRRVRGDADLEQHRAAAGDAVVDGLQRVRAPPGIIVQRCLARVVDDGTVGREGLGDTGREQTRDAGLHLVLSPDAC